MGHIKALRTVGGRYVCVETINEDHRPTLIQISNDVIIGIDDVYSELPKKAIHIFIKQEASLFCSAGMLEIKDNTPNWEVSLLCAKQELELKFKLT